MKVGDQTKQDASVQLPRAVRVTVNRDMTLATGTLAVTGVGFQPSCLITFAQENGTDLHSMGFAAYDPDQTTLSDISGTYIYNDTMDVSGQMAWLYQIGAPLTRYFANLDSFDADGFTIGFQKVGSTTGTMRLDILCFK